MHASTSRWTIAIDNLETRLRVGIWDHEREFQPVRVNLAMACGAVAEAPTAGAPDYRRIARWITEEWSRQPHTLLLETRLRELMDYVFGCDARIAWLDVALSKPQACPEARGVGVRMALTRSQYQALYGTDPADRAAAEVVPLHC